MAENNKYSEIHPGEVWFDTTGKRIQAHGGAVFYEEGTYYWYGENKEKTTGKNDIWTWGIKVYSSEDLYNWKDLGFLIPPVTDDPGSVLYPSRCVDRPHIVKCEKTGKYVCWIKLSGTDSSFVVLDADRFLGPYEIRREKYQPLGQEIGDFDIAVDRNSGRAYLFVECNHSSIQCMELSDDYMSVTGLVSRQYEGRHAPFCREGVAVFEKNGKKYMLTSGMSGYVPNKSDAAAADRWENVFESIGNPHVNDDSNASFNSQISYVFRVCGKKDLYIAMADRWVPGYKVDAARADMIERCIASHFEPDKYQATKEEKEEFMRRPDLHTANTSLADYVWLPLRVNEKDGKIEIEWHDSWKTEDYE